eukprot:SAG22_NODE_853_length_6848_cov_6.656394_9_plen_255_part_00
MRFHNNRNTLGLHPQVDQFLKQFELSEYQTETLLITLREVLEDAMAISDCAGESDQDCAHLYREAACEWLHGNSHTWQEFLPEHAHCGIGEKTETLSNSLTSICTPCEPGRFMSHSTYEDFCHACPAGRFNEETGAASCVECPAGMYGDQTAAVLQVDACIDCDPGSYQDEDGETHCKQCPRGTYQIAIGATFCAVCTTGQYQANVSATFCEQCPVNATSCSVEMDDASVRQTSVFWCFVCSVRCSVPPRVPLH